VLPAAPAAARTDEPAAMRTYVQARAAATEGALAEASRSYAAALAAAPDNRILASSALGHAIAAGDRALAVAAARMLESTGEATPEVRLTLLVEAVRAGQWRAAEAQVERISADRAFAFMAPVLRAWVAQGSRRGDPIAILDAIPGDSPAQGYVPEARALLQLVRRGQDTAAEYAAFADESGPRAQRLRIAGAALLARRDGRREALALLAGPGEALGRARAAVEARQALPGAIATPAEGIAEFLVRLALDLNSQEVRPLALSFTRLAGFLAPDNSEIWLVAAELLRDLERPQAALAALASIPPSDPFIGSARDLRMNLLVANEQNDMAVREAQAATAASGARVTDWTRLGDLYVELDRYREAAEAYERAIALAGAGSSDNPLWALWLIRGGALERAGDWPAGKAALERAHALAPEQPLVLNYLGYAQLERRENIAEAMRLVSEAHRLAPENASITDSLGWGYYLTGDLPRAIELLERAAQGEPADTTINEHLGDAYYRAGRRIEARFAWKAALVYAEPREAERLRAKIEAGLTPQLAAR
jgi:tetratricopeptide (TPR) repeat protein